MNDIYYNFAKYYFEQGADEICYIDNVATLYGTNNLSKFVKRTAQNIFIPLAVGGGIRSLNDIDKALRSGADKVAINSYATENPNFIREAVKKFGSSTITVYIEAKNIGDGKWEAYKNSGRDKTGLEIVDWIQRVQDYNCGELILTSIDYEGLQKGFDLELLNKIYQYVNVPLIFNGGCGKIEDIVEIKKKYENVSFSIASAFHYKKISIKKLKNEKNLYS